MATRRRIGVSAASTEAARRQLMQPVPCWERILVTPEVAPPGSTLKVWKWVKTDKVQHFSDDEGGVDDPLAPLPDEPDVGEGDEEMELDETQNTAITATKPAESMPTLDALGASLKPMVDADMHDLDGKEGVDTGVELDMGTLGPDGLGLDGSGLSQIDPSDALVGGPLLDQTDPFGPAAS
ncbi:hypothetical protein AN958_09651 [Leucoagaricus sp. SymC.cos]|nr:hypothetical protein AN958_09651 [Leucoagaricus sp. SymC.cos]